MVLNGDPQKGHPVSRANPDAGIWAIRITKQIRPAVQNRMSGN